MEAISFEELFMQIKCHLHDELDYLIDITEEDWGYFIVNFKEENVKKKLKMDGDTFFAYLFDRFFKEFNDISIIRVHSTSSGDFIYMRIGGKVCILFKSNYIDGQKWIASLVNKC